MRAIAVLTALVSVGILAGAGQTKEAQESKTTNTQLVAKYDRLLAHTQAVERRFFCKGTKAYLRTKRTATWKWQDAAYVPRTRTSYADRRTKCSPYLKWQAQLWAGRAEESFRFYVSLRDPKDAICHIFGNYCSEAIGVASCETGGTFDTKASNGQYLGLFQMGSSERETYGHSNSALGQSYAAWLYFAASGRDWSPWSCRWAAS